MSQTPSLPTAVSAATYANKPGFDGIRPAQPPSRQVGLLTAQETPAQPPSDALDVTRRQATPVMPAELSFPEIAPIRQAQAGSLTPPSVPVFESDFGQAETVRLAALYLSDNPETVVQSGSGVLSPEQTLPPDGISRVTLYHSFVSEDDKQAYVTVSAAQPGSFHLRGQGVSSKDPLTASREANANYPNPVASLKLAILSATGKREVTLTYNTSNQRYEPAVDLAAGERAFLPVGEQIKGTKQLKTSTQLDNAHRNASKTVVARLDIEPVGGAVLAAGTYVEGKERKVKDQGLQAEDYRRMQEHAEGDYVQSPIVSSDSEFSYGKYQGDAVDPKAPKTLIKAHHSMFIRLDPSGVIPYRDQDVGIDKATGRPFVRLIGARDGAAEVDSDLDGRFNEPGDDVFRPDNGQPLDRSKKSSATEATAGWIDRKLPGQRVLKDEGDRDGYGLPYLIPNRVFSRPGQSPGQPDTVPNAGDQLRDGQLILCGEPHKPKYDCKYAVTVIDANNVKHDFLIGAGSNGTKASRDNFWALDLKKFPLTLPIRVISHEGSDLGVQLFYDPPGGDDLSKRTKGPNAKGQMVLEKMSE